MRLQQRHQPCRGREYEERLRSTRAEVSAERVIFDSVQRLTLLRIVPKGEEVYQTREVTGRKARAGVSYV